MITTDSWHVIRRRIDHHGQITIRRDPTAARMILGVPMIEVLSIGAGGGTMARIDPLTTDYSRPGVGRRNARTRMLWPRRDDPRR